MFAARWASISCGVQGAPSAYRASIKTTSKASSPHAMTVHACAALSSAAGACPFAAASASRSSSVLPRISTGITMPKRGR